MSGCVVEGAWEEEVTSGSAIIADGSEDRSYYFLAGGTVVQVRFTFVALLATGDAKIYVSLMGRDRSPYRYTDGLEEGWTRLCSTG